MVVVIVATTSEVKKKAFEASGFASHLRAVGAEYKYVECGDCGGEFAGHRWPQPFTASGGMLAAMQRISSIRKHTSEMSKNDVKYYDESGMLLGTNKSEKNRHQHYDDIIVIAIESYITENAKDCVCIIVNYYVDGEKRELVAFSPAAYIASFPEKYLHHLFTIEKYQSPGVMGFKTTIGDVIDLEKHIHGGGVSKNWHKLFNPFDRIEQIRETLNYIEDEFKKIVDVTN